MGSSRCPRPEFARGSYAPSRATGESEPLVRWMACPGQSGLVRTGPDQSGLVRTRMGLSDRGTAGVLRGGASRPYRHGGRRRVWRSQARRCHVRQAKRGSGLNERYYRAFPFDGLNVAMGVRLKQVATRHGRQIHYRSFQLT